MHNAEKPNPPASVRDTGGQGELSASSNTRARNSLRAVATHNAPSPGVHGERDGALARKSTSAPRSEEHSPAKQLLCPNCLRLTHRVAVGRGVASSSSPGQWHAFPARDARLSAPAAPLLHSDEFHRTRAREETEHDKSARLILPRQVSSACCCILTRRASEGSASEPALARRKICEI